jgi:hypothetical protein
LGILLPFNINRPGTMAGHLVLSRLQEKRLEPPRHALTPGGSMRGKLRANDRLRKWKRRCGGLSDFREFSLTGQQIYAMTEGR